MPNRPLKVCLGWGESGENAQNRAKAIIPKTYKKDLMGVRWNKWYFRI